MVYTDKVAWAQSIGHCRERCGALQVPYPFGMDSTNCYLGEKFLITCNETSQPPKAFLMKGNLPVADISLDGELTVMMRVARDCYTKQGKNFQNWNSTIWVPQFTISSTKNKFVAIGCDTNAFVQANRVEERYATGCISFCNSTHGFNKSCSGSGCCKAPIASGLKNVTVQVNSYYNHRDIWDFNPCSYAFVVEESKFNFSLAILQKMDKEQVPPRRPIVINWAIGKDDKIDRCEEAKNRVNYACKQNSECVGVDDGSGGYRCKCLEGYQGNPYHPDGCQGNPHPKQQIPPCPASSYTGLGKDVGLQIPIHRNRDRGGGCTLFTFLIPLYVEKYSHYIDECHNSNPCEPGKCSNSPGKWKCIRCPKGYNNNGTACTKSNNATDQSKRHLLLYSILVANVLEALVNLEKHPWGKVDLSGEELGSSSNTFENSSGESGMRSGATSGDNYACKQNTECMEVDYRSGGYRCKCLEGYQGNPNHPDGCRDIDECQNSKPLPSWKVQ
ncbi:hypothetical protein FEM48_Zijuj01G0103800 [Ziziphus jujuba var. spinosa]|uniref:EGF-like domain-containing protein n=1 Tax=Ziziphus jujuba var. spinosa TaxID=714518 RepID=A0A978W0P9_ZIZJJ|nr:hypothetical protein FEM48_Zijuj01G0103800 [Ziziphus jujuba var. spinosa]